MPSPQARPAVSQPASTLPARIESALLMAACIFLGFVLPLLLRSRFDGVWFRTGGDPNTPAELKLLARHGKFSEIIPVNCFGSYETVTLVADGREHTWSEPASTCHLAFESGINSYAAQLTGSSFSLTKHIGPATISETWNIVASDRLVVTQNGRAATYKRASWFRSLFTEEP